MRASLCLLAALGLFACDPNPVPVGIDAGMTGGRDTGSPGECRPGQMFCNGRCIPTETNPLHCGGCGNVCDSDETCEDGSCRGTQQCPAGQRDCGGGCTEVEENAMHCGRCGNECDEGESCLAGSCEPDTCPAERPDRCGTGCTSVADDNANCGACGTKCAPDETCANSSCASACTDGETACVVEEATTCIAVGAIVEHCTGCNEACGAGQTCDNGSCACASDETMCGARCVDTDTDPAHCGTCDSPCSAGSACLGGDCQCPSGQTECGGACVNTMIDTAHCGMCDDPCASGESCVGGSCEGAGGCGAGETMCGASCVNLASEAMHCGACGRACTDGPCTDGACRPANDARLDAIDVMLPGDGSEATVTGSTDGATVDLPADLSCSANGTNVWYRVVLPTAGVLWVDTAGADYDTAIFVTTEAGAQSPGLCNDDCPCGAGGDFSVLDSCATRRVSAGTYYISVGGYSTSEEGAFTLHVQFLPDVGYLYTTRMNGLGTSADTLLLDDSEAEATCTGTFTDRSGEDQRWFASCGAGATHRFSLCQDDGGSWEGANADGLRYDPVLYIRSARTGMEEACNDDGAGGNCEPVDGGPDFGSRITDHQAGRGVHGVFIDSRGVGLGGMNYSMRYEVPSLDL